MSKRSVFETLADGLEASVDGRGWNSEHERARLLANAAPEMLEALKDAMRWIDQAQKYTGDSIMPEKLAEVIAKAEGAQ